MRLRTRWDELLVGQHNGLVEVGVTDEAIIDEEVLLSTTPQCCRWRADEATYATEVAFVAHGEQCLGELSPSYPEYTLLLCATREHLVILPCPLECEGYLWIG